jgi:preprotein translocase subunit Sss1
MQRTGRAPRTDEQRTRSLAEVEALAWLLDNSIPVPGTGGRRFGVDAVIGLVPGIGDIVSGALGLIVVWRGSRMGLPRIVVGRMLLNTLLDIAVGAIPILGDAFDLWFKASTRNLGLMRRHLERPDTSTRDDWLAVLLMVGVVIGIIVAIGWLIVSLVAALVGALS